MQQLQTDICKSNNLYILENQTKAFTIFIAKGVPYLLCQQKVNEADLILTLIDGKINHLCGFLRFVNLSFFFNLKNLLQIIQSHNIADTKWVALYQILSFDKNNFQKYQFQHPSYGEQVLIPTIFKDQFAYEKRITSNCFSFNDQCYYFIEKESGNMQEKSLGEIVDVKRKKIKGFCYKIQTNLVCIPLNIILHLQKTKIHINQSVRQILSKTVYLQHNGNNSTGTLIDSQNILTVKHAFACKSPQVGEQINIRIYPYLQSFKAIIKIKSIFDSIDAVLLQIQQPKKSVKKIRIEETPLMLQQQKICQVSDQLEVGSQILALGFGKYNYPLRNFNVISQIFPTIMRGILSKKIEISSQTIAFKTDANLYHGFSGCAIWKGNNQIGMAIFIIKNTTTFNHLTKHNFSLSYSFLKKYLQQTEQRQKDKSIRQFLSKLDKFGVRKQMIINSRL